MLTGTSAAMVLSQGILITRSDSRATRATRELINSESLTVSGAESGEMAELGAACGAARLPNRVLAVWGGLLHPSHAM